MSTASQVPETFHLQGDDARETIRHASMKSLVRDTVSRLRWADGFSHARATAFQTVLTLIPGLIVLVAVAARLQWESLSSAIIRSIESLAPGPASDVFRDAFERGNRAGDSSDWIAIMVGSIAMLISGATAFGQVERTSNRIYGVESDRPSMRKYAHGLFLMLSAGTMIGLYFAVAGLGSGWGAASSEASQWWWTVGRWVVGAVFLALAITVIFQSAPRRRQPAWSWLMSGTIIAISGVVLISLLLNFYLNASSSFGETYGPLAGFLGLLVWTYLASLAVYFGLAFAAQLEAVRAGLRETRSAEKIEAGEPDTAVVSYAAALRRST
jgi:YihY family inner membrane protein